MKRFFLASTLAFAATGALADCIAPLPRVTPAIPDGKSASADVMAQAGDDVRRYVRGLESYLNCRSALPPLQHNYLVDQAEAVAGAYNDELARFFGREEMLATK